MGGGVSLALCPRNFPKLLSVYPGELAGLTQGNAVQTRHGNSITIASLLNHLRKLTNYLILVHLFYGCDI